MSELVHFLPRLLAKKIAENTPIAFSHRYQISKENFQIRC